LYLRQYPQPCLEGVPEAPRNMQVHNVGVPYWFLPDEGGAMTPATYEEMANTSDIYLKVS
jgi:hypothetical protein